MKTAVINIKVDPEIKALAQARAKKQGVSLSYILSNHLQTFASGQKISMEFPEEKLTPRLAKLIAEVEKENKELGTVGPFEFDDAIDYLKNLPHDQSWLSFARFNLAKGKLMEYYN